MTVLCLYSGDKKGTFHPAVQRTRKMSLDGKDQNRIKDKFRATERHGGYDQHSTHGLMPHSDVKEMNLSGLL